MFRDLCLKFLESRVQLGNHHARFNGLTFFDIQFCNRARLIAGKLDGSKWLGKTFDLCLGNGGQHQCDNGESDNPACPSPAIERTSKHLANIHDRALLSGKLLFNFAV